MSDMPPGQPAPPAPPPAAPQPGAANPTGSLGLGIGLAWACLIGGYIAVALIATMVFSALGGSSDAAAVIAMLSTLAPWIAMLVLAIWFAKNGQSRTALGIGVGFASILGVLLLLVAACFGILSTANFH